MIYRWSVVAIIVASIGMVMWRLQPRQNTPRDATTPAGPLKINANAVHLAPEWEKLLADIDPQFQPADDTVAEGKRLSEVHCRVCHVRPEADVLPQRSWLEAFNHLNPALGKETPFGTASLALPAKAMREYRIPPGDAAKIIYYYLVQAPQTSLPQTNQPALGPKPAPFKVKFSAAANPIHPEAYVLAKILNDGSRIVLGKGFDSALVIVNTQSGDAHQLKISGVATGFIEHDDSYYLTLMGPSPYPDDTKLGKVVQLPVAALKKGATPQEKIILSNLGRPVHTTIADLDGDNLEDLLVEEFGFSDGGLYWYKRRPDASFEKQTLIEQSGSLSSHVGDYNHDGVTDIFALISQNIETVFLFAGSGKGQFKQNIIAQKHPGFGSNQIIMADVNGDKIEDVILINGDNMDLPTQPLKNYHGIHILLNDGQNKFEESYFYAFNGANQAVARDFDLDGDIDIVAVAMFPDFSKRPLETFIFLENKTSGRNTLAFEPRSLPATERARWSVLDAGDIDHDGDDDLVLGAAILPSLEKQWTDAFGDTDRYSYMLLENTTRKARKTRASPH